MPVGPALLPLGAAIVGGVLGWWPLASWVDRVLVRRTEERIPLSRIRVCAAVATAMGFGLVTWVFGAHPVTPALLAVVSAGVVLSIVDLIEHRLPNSVVIPTFILVAVLLAVASALEGDLLRLLWAFAGAAGMFALYFVLALMSPAGMGMGDVKLAALLGLTLGWFGWDAWLLGLVAGFVVGGIVALLALLSRRVTIRGAIPFGPSMLTGALAALVLLAG